MVDFFLRLCVHGLRTRDKVRGPPEQASRFSSATPGQRVPSMTAERLRSTGQHHTTCRNSRWEMHSTEEARANVRIYSDTLPHTPRTNDKKKKEIDTAPSPVHHSPLSWLCTHSLAAASLWRVSPSEKVEKCSWCSCFRWGSNVCPFIRVW